MESGGRGVRGRIGEDKPDWLRSLTPQALNPEPKRPSKRDELTGLSPKIGRSPPTAAQDARNDRVDGLSDWRFRVWVVWGTYSLAACRRVARPVPSSEAVAGNLHWRSPKKNTMKSKEKNTSTPRVLAQSYPETRRHSYLQWPAC